MTDLKQIILIAQEATNLIIDRFERLDRTITKREFAEENHLCSAYIAAGTLATNSIFLETDIEKDLKQFVKTVKEILKTHQ